MPSFQHLDLGPAHVRCFKPCGAPDHSQTLFPVTLCIPLSVGTTRGVERSLERQALLLLPTIPNCNLGSSSRCHSRPLPSLNLCPLRIPASPANALPCTAQPSGNLALWAAGMQPLLNNCPASLSVGCCPVVTPRLLHNEQRAAAGAVRPLPVSPSSRLHKSFRVGLALSLGPQAAAVLPSRQLRRPAAGQFPSFC
jgi:hypothetical protein